MAKARALAKRRKSIRNIRKITRTMELIATARFKKAMDRAVAATAYTRKITELVSELATTGLKVSHPLLESRDKKDNATLLVLTANRGLCGGYNGAIVRAAVVRYEALTKEFGSVRQEVSGKRGASALKFRKQPIHESFTQFEDQPKYIEVEAIANRYLEAYAAGKLDRLDVAYTKFLTSSRQVAVVETLLPLGSLAGAEAADDKLPPGKTPPQKGEAAHGAGAVGGTAAYEFLPSAEAILEEVVPVSFKVKLFKCFLDAAVSEQIARMVAMKSATENAEEIIKNLSRDYNRARQSQITSEIMEIIGGAEALKS